jgi:tetratricopeptide (TPR) repeat protein
MAFVAERLRRGGLTVVPNESTLGLLGRAGPAPDANWLRQAAGVDLVVDARVVRDGGIWRLSVGALDGHGVRRNGEARDADLLRAARIASDRLLAALGRHAPDRGDADLDLAERTQRAEAARLANELTTARDILLSAPPSQRGSPRLRYELAQVYTRAGDFAGAMAILTPLLSDARVAGDPAFLARVLVARGQVRMRQAQIADAMHDFDAAVRLLDPDRHHGELGRALTYRGVTRSGLRDFDAALADLGQARIHLLRAHDALAVARVDANLGVLELNRGRPAYAIDYLRKAAAVFESFGAVQELMITRSHVLQVHLMQLQYAQAWAASERDWAMRDRVRDPGQRLSLALDRAEILIRQGQFVRARALLDDPELADAGALVNERRRAWINIELAWRRGDARDALRRADAVLDGWSEEAWDNTRAWVLLRRQQAALALGVVPLTMPASGDDAGDEAGIDRGSAVPERLARAIALRAAGDLAGADALYTRALSLAERRGIPSEIADAVSAYTPWLIARGRLAIAGSLVGRVGLWADRDYECALLQVQLYHALGHRDLWLSALDTARHMAGERSIPSALTTIPRPRAIEIPAEVAVTTGNITRK